MQQQLSSNREHLTKWSIVFCVKLPHSAKNIPVIGLYHFLRETMHRKGSHGQCHFAVKRDLFLSYRKHTQIVLIERLPLARRQKISRDIRKPA
ncbi:hypothetical protein D3C85_1348320 [compost metagenome]